MDCIAPLRRGSDAIHQCPLDAVALCFLLTCALLMTSSHSEGGMDWKLNGKSAPELEHFFAALTFCDQLVRIGPLGLVRRMAQLLSIGFIQPVLLPKLHQTQVDEAVAATAYLDACIR